MPPRVYPFWMVSLRCPSNLSESAQGCIYLNMRITSITTVKQVEPEAHIFNCDTSALIASESFLSMRDALTSRAHTRCKYTSTHSHLPRKKRFHKATMILHRVPLIPMHPPLQQRARFKLETQLETDSHCCQWHHCNLRRYNR